jgi:hypothetical protein
MRRARAAELVLLFNLVWTAAPAAPPAANPDADLVSVFVEWHAHVHGARTVVRPAGSRNYPGTWTITGAITKDMTGSAIVRYRNGVYYDVTYGAVNLRYEAEEWQTTVDPSPDNGGVCYGHVRAGIIDPAAYSGFHADARTSFSLWELISNGDPTASRSGSFPIVKALAPTRAMAYTIRWTRESSGTCAGEPVVKEGRGFGYAPATRSDAKSIHGEFTADSADRSSFSLNARWSEHSDEGYESMSPIQSVPVDITWTGHAYRMGKCAQHPAPIEAGDKIINHEQVDLDADSTLLDPNPQVGADTNVTNVRIRVTCEGVPVENAQVQINVEAQDKSGGHIHSDDNRPRGTIDGHVVTKDGIEKNTDAYGQVRIKYGSPLTGSPDPAGYGTYNIGIAGTYKISAESKDVPGATAKLAILAKVDGLIPLPTNSNYQLNRGDTGGHPAGSHGTAATLSEFGNLANDFYQAQSDHNTELKNCTPQKTPWFNGVPVSLSINDIALPDGGVFDLGSNWKIGHQTHNRGEGGDFNKFKDIQWNGATAFGPECNGPPVKKRAWLLHTLLTLGQKYGKWDCSDLGSPDGCDVGEPPTSVGSIKFPNGQIETKSNTYPYRLHLHIQDASP